MQIENREGGIGKKKNPNREKVIASKREVEKKKLLGK